MNRFVSLIAPLGWLSSLGVHTAAVAWLLHSGQGEHVRPAAATVTLSVVSTPRVLQRVPAPPAPTKEHATDKPAAPRNAPKLAKESAHKPAPDVPTPVELRGVTLTGGQGAGWESMTGNGLAIDTPIRTALATAGLSAAPAPSRLAKATGSAQSPLEVVSVKDLATKPNPPALNHRLLANYPALAKQQGQAGSAKLLVRIDADGVVRQCAIQSESSTGFGEACRRTLLGSQWSAPHDRTGKAVATQVYYTCEFRVSGS